MINFYIDEKNPTDNCGTMTVVLVNETGGVVKVVDYAKGLATGANSVEWMPNSTSNFCPGSYKLELICNDAYRASQGTWKTELFELIRPSAVLVGCSAGEYLDGEKCADCPVGTFSSSSGSTECSVCRKGRFTPYTGSWSCSLCDAGKFISDDGYSAVLHDSSRDCSNCPPGFYSTAGSSWCTACTVGKFSAENASAECSRCPPGKYQSKRTQTECDECLAGTFSRSEATTCSTCRNGEWSSHGSGNCTMCAAGNFFDETLPSNRSLCRRCEGNGVVCEEPNIMLSQLEIKKGYYRISPSAWMASEIRECPMESACLGGTNFSGDGYCNKGYEGPYCDVCSKEYFKDKALQKCAPCNMMTATASFIASVLALASICFAFVVVCMRSTNIVEGQIGGSPDSGVDDVDNHDHILSYDDDAVDSDVEGGGKDDDLDDESKGGLILRARKDDDWLKVEHKLRIELSFCQVASMLVPLVDFPSAFKMSVSFLQFSEFDVFEMLPLECIFVANAYTKLLVATLLPMMIVFMLVAAHFIFQRKSKMICVGFMVLYVILPSSSAAIFRIYECDYFLDVDEAYMAHDYRVSCHDKDRVIYLAYSGLMVFIYPIGIPLLFAAALFKERKSLCPRIESEGWSFLFVKTEAWDFVLTNKGNKNSAAGWLAAPYQERAWWWPVFECICRLLLSSVLILLAPLKSGKIIVAFCVCLLSTRAYAYYSPFKNAVDGQFAELAQWQLCILFFVALLVQFDAISDEHAAGVSFFLVVATFSGFLFIAWALLRPGDLRGKGDGSPILVTESVVDTILEELLQNPTETKQKSALSDDEEKRESEVFNALNPMRSHFGEHGHYTHHNVAPLVMEKLQMCGPKSFKRARKYVEKNLGMAAALEVKGLMSPERCRMTAPAPIVDLFIKKAVHYHLRTLNEPISEELEDALEVSQNHEQLRSQYVEAAAIVSDGDVKSAFHPVRDVNESIVNVEREFRSSMEGIANMARQAKHGIDGRLAHVVGLGGAEQDEERIDDEFAAVVGLQDEGYIDDEFAAVVGVQDEEHIDDKLAVVVGVDDTAEERMDGEDAIGVVVEAPDTPSPTAGGRKKNRRRQRARRESRRLAV